MDDYHDIVTSFDGGVRLLVKAKPGARKARAPRLVDVGEGKRAVEIAVAEPPEDGKANKAVTRLLAKALGIAPSRLELVRGATGRDKLFRVI